DVRHASPARRSSDLLWVMSVGRYGEFLNLTDTTGRPLVPDGSGGPMNVLGIGSVNVDGIYRNLPIIATEGVDVDDEFAAVRSSRSEEHTSELQSREN